MVHFIYGAAHSGKTERVLGGIADDARDGRHTYLIVPEQETVALERRVVSMLEGSAQLCVEVVNFSRLCNLIFRATGGISYSSATPSARSLIMWNTIRELSPMLEEYRAGDLHDTSLTEKMLSAVTELKTYGISCSTLERACERLDRGTPLYRKLRDISLIYSAYSACLSESFDDSQDDIPRAMERLSDFAPIHGASVYIDSFSSFTGQELEFISTLSRICGEMYITVPLPSPDDASIHLEGVRTSLTRLKRALDGAKYDEICLPARVGDRDGALEYLSSELWNFEAPPFTGEVENVLIYQCETPYTESDTVACEIRRAMSEGVRCSEMAIILRSADEYRGILDVSLERYGIPYFMSEKTDLMTKPLTKFIFSALRIKEGGWRGTDVIAHLKSGFCDVDPFDADIFEDYISTWGISGGRFFDGEWTMNPDGYTAMLTPRGERILETANSVRKALTEPLSLYFARLDASASVKEMCSATLDFLKSSGITEKIRLSCDESLERGDKRSADEDMKLYTLTLTTLYDLAQIMGEKEFTTEEFSAALALMFSESEIGTIPTSADEVLIGTAPMLRAGKIRRAFVIGLNEGKFPAAISDTGIFTDADKQTLEALDIDLSSGTEARTSDELFYVCRALSAPSERLVLTFPTLSSDGSSQKSSIVIDRVCELLPDARRIKDREIPFLDRIWNAESARTVLTRLGDMVDAERLGVIDASDPLLSTPLVRRECSVSPDLVRQILGDRISLTQSRLEKYVLCGFDYYCSYVLGLRESKRAIFRLNDIGSFIHSILEGFMREITSSGTLDLSLSDEEIDRVLDRTVEKYLFGILGEDYAVSNRTRHLFLRLKRLSFVISKGLMEEFSNSDFYPEYFELGIGTRGSDIRALEFTLRDGSTVSLRGIADRVDTYKRDGNVYIRVIDYKTGSKEFSLDGLKNGLNTQLLIYLFSLCRAQSKEKRAELGCAEDGNIIPAGIQYLSTNAPTLSIVEPQAQDELERLIQEKFSRSGLLTSDPEILRAINHDLDPRYVSRVKVDADGSMYGKSIVSPKDFDMLFDMLTEVVVGVAQSLRDGKADAIPMVKKKGSTPCRYCKMYAICRAAVNEE